ncbi:MAG: hypothetical protein WBG50_07790 [Desulfomonilaceae bacterium]
MDPQEIKEIIIRELPSILREDPQMREFVLSLTEGRFADKAQTESRFDRLLDELRRDREAETERWKRLEEARAEERRQDAERWQEQNRRWEDNEKRWEDDKRRWEENQRDIRGILDEIKRLDRRHDATIGALGA